MFKAITVISGKGGVGKSTFSLGLAQFVKDCIIVDADVSAPDLNVILDSKQEKSIFFKPKNLIAEIGPECILCGDCVIACRFKAITKTDDSVFVRPELCTGCELCSHICPVDTIFMKERTGFPVKLSRHKFGKIIYSDPVPGQRISGGLVSFMRALAEKEAEETKKDRILIDASPGKGCHVISAITDSDFTVIITEPSKAAFKDLENSADLLKYFGQSGGVVINKVDLNRNYKNQIEQFSKENNLDFLGSLPYIKGFPGYLNKGILPLEIAERSFNDNMESIFKQINSKLEKQGD